MCIHRQSRHPQREKQNNTRRFHAYPGQLPEPIPGFIHGQISQKVQFESTSPSPYFLQSLLYVPGFDCTQASDFNCLAYPADSGIGYIPPTVKGS